VLRSKWCTLEGAIYDLQPMACCKVLKVWVLSCCCCRRFCSDVMPRNLRKLMLSSVESVKQLQDLTALETLELWSAETMEPEVLRQISGLANIT
jgi:hypothetical protein